MKLLWDIENQLVSIAGKAILVGRDGKGFKWSYFLFSPEPQIGVTKIYEISFSQKM